MKKFQITICTIYIFLFSTVLFSISSCATSTNDLESKKAKEAEKVQTEAQEELGEAQKAYNKKYEAFKEESNKMIAENEKYIAKLKAEAKTGNNEAKNEIDIALEKLEQRNQMLKNKLNDYKDEGEEKWESFKVELNHDMTELGKALKDLGTNNKK
ncbi:MAG: hypothetical protein WED33_04695 [Bacteroidia bacterium]